MKNRFNVLVVDDDEADFFLIKETLEASKWPVGIHYAKDGEDAIQFLENSNKQTNQRPDLILLDLNMPRLCGHEFLRYIKSNECFASIPALVLSTSTADEDIRKSYELQASCHVEKPFDLTDYTTVIESICHFWFRTARFPPRNCPTRNFESSEGN